MTLNVAPVMIPLQQVYYDKTTGQPLVGGFLQFFEDSNRTNPKVVYQIEGSGPGSYTYVSLGSELELSGIGSIVDNNGENIQVYLWPFTGSPNDPVPSQIADNYYIKVLDSNGGEQWDIPNVPGVQSSDQPFGTGFNITENVISNSQFTDVNFSTQATASSPVVFPTTGTNTATEIAPDWSVITTGSGSFSVWQVTVNDDTAPGNPTYALGILSSGYTQPIQLRQRLFAPRIFSKEYVSGTFIAETIGSQYTLSMNYTPSITGIIQQICSGITATAGFTEISNPTPILITDPGSGTGYIDITIVIPVNASVILSCVQLCATNNSLPVEYLQQTPAEEADRLFHYFQPQLNFKPTSSYLTGWDFTLNPKQLGTFGALGSIGANAGAYAWDQTIVFQSVNNSVAFNQNANGDLVLTAITNTQCAIIQYLAVPEIYDLLSHNMSVSTTLACSSSNTPITISLWCTTNASVPPVTLNSTFINSLDANGHPNSVAAGWTEIARQYGNATFFAATGINNINAATSGFSGWQELPLSVTVQQKFFAIVVSTGVLPATGVVEFNQVSLVAGDIPTRPAPKTLVQTLLDCQYYLEKSYPYGVNPAFGPRDLEGVNLAVMTAVQPTTIPGTAFLLPNAFGIRYNTQKYYNGNLPNVTLFDVNGIPGAVQGYLTTNGVVSNSVQIPFLGNWTLAASGATGISFFPSHSATLLSASTSGGLTVAFIEFQYVIDARIGII